jgi:hypothetical protein
MEPEMAENIAVAATDDDFDDAPASAASADQATGKTFTQADLDRIVADRVAREKAKYADYGDLKKKAAAAMSEHDKALAEAEQRGRSAALGAAGTRLAKAELRAAAAGVVAREALDGFLEYADLSRFVGEDGEPDDKAITAAIKKLSGAGVAAANGTNYDGGARTSGSKPVGMNDLIRRQAGFA